MLFRPDAKCLKCDKDTEYALKIAHIFTVWSCKTVRQKDLQRTRAIANI